MGFNFKNEIPCFYIDNEINTRPEEDIIEDRAEDELKYLNN